MKCRTVAPKKTHPSSSSGMSEALAFLHALVWPVLCHSSQASSEESLGALYVLPMHLSLRLSQERIQRGLWLETVKSWSQRLAFSIWAESALWPFLIPQKLECISLLGLLWKRQQTREYRKHDLFHTLPEAEDLLPQGSGDAGSLLVTLGLARLAVLLF